MKKFLLIFFLTTLYTNGQTLYSVEYKSQADVNIFVVDYKSQADLLVYKVDYKSQAKGNEGLWHFVEYKSQADFRVCLLYTSPSPRDLSTSRMPSSA